MRDQTGSSRPPSTLNLPPERQVGRANEAVHEDSRERIDGYECENGDTDSDGLDQNVLDQFGHQMGCEKTEGQGDQS